jgi:hypothetical protein
MHVARDRRRRRVVIGMRIQPQHEKLTAGFAAMPRDPFTEPIDSE